MCDKPQIEDLQKQLVISRNELKNLRQKLLSLTVEHRKDVDTIKAMLLNALEGKTAESSSNADSVLKPLEATGIEGEADKTMFEPIGVVRSVFNEKRAVPRQAMLVNDIQGCVEINCFNNPEHSLQGLNLFSHIWIIYHFHRNSPHSKAKVAPPRLNGDRVGVFSTRSPHRPCPIGLSLVRIDRIEGNKIYFFGTDMVDGTPVLDLKPYIPKYDCPAESSEAEFTHSSSTLFCTREAPDGEENVEDGATNSSSSAAVSGPATSSSATISTTTAEASGTVRVPNWITSGPTLKVLFSEQALSQIEELGINRRTIVELLETDPRSVYLRTKHGSQVQIFTFQLSDNAVTCKFDDANGVVTVVQVRN